jgi:FkbM family methyltransferase
LFKKLIKKLGNQLRRVTLPLAGFWDVRALLVDQGSRTDALLNKVSDADARLAHLEEALPSLAEPLQFLGEALQSNEERTRSLIVTQKAAITANIERIVTQEVDRIVTREIDRLDRYLCYHRAMVQQELTSKAPLYVGSGLDALVRLSNGAFLTIPTNETGLLSYIVAHGVDAIEPGVGRVISSRLHSGGIAIDCGGNIGIHTINMAAAVGRQGKVICFEPLPHLARAIRQSLLVNGFSSFVHVEEAAVSNSVGSSTINAAAHSPLSSLFQLDSGVVANALPISVTSLDAFIPTGERIDMIKLDIEGAEPLAWRGMQRIVSDNPDLEIIMEWSSSHFSRSGEKAPEFMNEIRAAGFNAFVIQDWPVGVLRPVVDGEISTLDGANILFTRRTAGEVNAVTP